MIRGFMALIRGFMASLAAAGLVAATAATAQDADFQIAIKDHRFVPAELEVPAGKRIRLIVDNQDRTPEEFESRSLRLEKVIPGRTKVAFMIGPLKPGRYAFVGEFHESTAKGVLVAR